MVNTKNFTLNLNNYGEGSTVFPTISIFFLSLSDHSLVDFVSYYEITQVDIYVLDNTGDSKRSNKARLLLNLSAFNR